jgi:hypothetical protein
MRFLGSSLHLGMVQNINQVFGGYAQEVGKKIPHDVCRRNCAELVRVGEILQTELPVMFLLR